MESSRHAEESLNFDLLRSLKQTNQIIKTRIKPPTTTNTTKKPTAYFGAAGNIPGAWKERIVAGWLPPIVPPLRSTSRRHA
jgi:hypothetical protein